MKIKVLTDILQANDAIATENKQMLEDHKILTLNMMSSPGAGKTTLLEKTLELYLNKRRIGVIEGDIATSRDAERLERFGIPVIQINTGSACHLDANMIKKALLNLDLSLIDLLFIENVGNLVCPAEFKVGEDHKVVVLSVTEGDDKPLKYPLMFRESSLLLLNKIDLLPYTNFNIQEARKNALQINPSLDVIEISCSTGEGLDLWLNWLEERRG